MNLYNLLIKFKMVIFAINHEDQIVGISNCLDEEKYDLLNRNIFDVIKESLQDDAYDDLILKIKNQIEIDQCFNEKLSLYVGDQLLSFELFVDVLKKSDVKAILKFTHFTQLDISAQEYTLIFNEYDNLFTGYRDLMRVGKFIIDVRTQKDIVYGDQWFPYFLDIEKAPDNLYYVVDDNDEQGPYSLKRDIGFSNQFHLLVNGEIDYITDVWSINDKYLQTEAKVYQRDKDGKPTIIIGLIFDVTKYRNYNDLSQMKQIYDLAISSGNIGIFYYNIERYGKSMFIANDIYANLLGLEPNDLGLFEFADFEKSIITIEEDLTGKKDTKKLLGLLMEGQVDGTTDHLVKVRNLKTKEELYLLSSSKIQSRYEDGSMKEFGGFIIDVTARIESEKNKVVYAYTDDLTSLPNKRKLLKDMRDRSEGIGIYIDLDDFKKVNDKYGHNNGDRVLTMFSSALQSVCSDLGNVYPYRLHGDEFFVFFESKNLDIIEQLQKNLREKCDIELGEIEIPIDFSCGYSLYNSKKDIDDFIKEADYQMYKEKFTKKANYFNQK